MRTIAMAILTCAALAPLEVVVAAAPLIGFRPAKERFTLHEPVYVEFTAQNTEYREIKVDLGANRKCGFVFDLVRPDGTREGGLQLPVSDLVSPGIVAISPTDTYRQRLLLNEWTAFTEVGDYQFLGRVGDGAPTPFVIRVAPRDEKVLDSVCRELTRRILEAPQPLERDELTRGLKYVEDPVAVPYIARIVGADLHSEVMLVSTLGRIGTPAAVDVLIRALRSEDEATCQLARNTLSRVAGETTSRPLRDRIRAALGDR